MPTLLFAGACSIGGEAEGNFHLQARIGARWERDNPAKSVVWYRTLCSGRKLAGNCAKSFMHPRERIRPYKNTAGETIVARIRKKILLVVKKTHDQTSKDGHLIVTRKSLPVRAVQQRLLVDTALTG